MMPLPTTNEPDRTDLQSKSNPFALFGSGKNSRPAPIEPVGAAEFGLMLQSAQTMPGAVGLLAAARFFPAALLTLVETGVDFGELIQLKAAALNGRRLRIGRKTHELHALTLEALNSLGWENRELLLPWPFDNQQKPFYMFYRKAREILFRAGLPHERGMLLHRLKYTAAVAPLRLDSVDLSLPFTPKEGCAHSRRLRDYRRKLSRLSQTQTAIPDLTLLPETSLRRFFAETYRTLKLNGRTERAVEGHRSTLAFFNRFLNREAEFKDLTEDCVERFMAWLSASGRRSNATVNNHRCHLLALWRYAWKKYKTDELPRDVEKLPAPKTVPEAWSLEELRRLVAAAMEMRGIFHDVPRAAWMVSLIMVYFYTGLRRKVLAQLPRTAFDPETGWLTVPAGFQKQKAEQVFRLPAECIEALKAVTATSRPLLLGPFSQTHLRMVYKQLLASAGLPTTSRDMFHKLRKTSATMVCDVADEETARKHLGHSHVSVTRRYIDPRKLKKGGASELLPSVVAPDQLGRILVAMATASANVGEASKSVAKKTG